MGDCYITRRGGSGGGSLKNAFPVFTYSGNYELIDDGIAAKMQNWRIKFLTSGTLRFTEAPGSIDVFLVGGGAGGANWSNGSNPLGGGGGGRTLTDTFVPQVGTDYEIVIGAGGPQYTNGGLSSAFGFAANGGSVGSDMTGGAGGSGGGAGDVSSGGHDKGADGGSDGSNGSNSDGGNGGQGQGTTTREFGEATGDLYAGGGGGGGQEEAGLGGEGGGGNGATYSAQAQPGQTNTGGGGGGGGYPYDNPTRSAAGGSGIVVIRNSREVAA